MKTIQTYGYDRRAKVPAIAGTVAKLCIQCEDWFAAHGKERRCDACVPATERRRRAQRRHYTDLAQPGRQRQPERVLGLSLCYELARELAAKIDYPKGAPQPMSSAVKRGYIARAVWDGLQGKCDLARYASKS